MAPSTNTGMMPPRAYPDWMRLIPRRFYDSAYQGKDSWFFYYNMDWENTLIYAMILHNKDYQIEGGTPQWFSAYVERFELRPFDCGGKDVTLTFYKQGWVRNTLTFHMHDRISPSGMAYNVSSRIQPDPEFLAGSPAPGRAAVPQEVWERYTMAHIERLKAGCEWNPGEK